jgi:hypothetical protein
MKPHLRKKGGIWSCSSYRLIGGRVYVDEIGYGDKPRAAWDDLHSRMFDQ